MSWFADIKARQTEAAAAAAAAPPPSGAFTNHFANAPEPEPAPSQGAFGGAFARFREQNNPAPPPTPAPSSPTPKTGNAQNDFLAYVQAKGYDGGWARSNMPQIVNEFNQLYGYNVQAGNPNASGLIDAVNFGDGWFDVIKGGSNQWQMLREGDGGTGGTGGPDDALLARFGAPVNPYASRAFGETYTNPDLPPELQKSYVAGTFSEPTLADLEASPGYMARLKLGEQGVQRNASAQGTVLGGGTLKSLERYRQDYASNEYQNLFGQRLSAFNTNEAGRLAERQQNVGEFQNKVGNANLQYANRYKAFLDENARTLSDYLTNYGVSRNMSSDWWAQMNAVADRGLRAAENARPS